MRALRSLAVLALLAAALVAWNLLRPVPAVAASQSVPAEVAVQGSPPALPWPGAGSAAVGVSGLGGLASSGNEQALPAASVTKVMTALVVLTDKPMKAGESGPAITITQQDVQAYQSDRAQKQSVVAVKVGEQLTELQALEALLIPSGNNIAETLARWDAGSVAAFVTKMNARATAMKLTSTKFADPAGVDPASVSTPSDLLKLGMEAMRDPVFARVVQMPQADLPVAGTVYNVDAALGHDGINGIKTGSGLSLGANFLFSAAVQVGGHPVTVFGCVMGQSTLADAFSAARALVRAVAPALSVKLILARNQAVGAYHTAWGDRSDVVSTVDVAVIQWPGLVLRQRLDAPALNIGSPLAPGTAAGTLNVVLGDYDLAVPLVTARGLYPAGRWWRIARLPWTG